MWSRFRLFLNRHTLLDTLVNLRGNPRACVYTEALWSIPFNLYTPFFTLYMYALGVSDRQIGLLISLGLFFQIFTALLSGVLTDKLGRRKTTVIFDTISWSIPTLLWAISQNFWWFLIAAIFNSLGQITHNSWNLLMVEDSDQKKLVHIYTWCTVSGLLAVFFSPLAGIMVDRLTVVPAMRIIFAITFVMMSAKFILLYIFSSETGQGKIRQEETKDTPLWHLLTDYKHIALKIIKTKETILVLGLLLLLNITTMITNSFFSLYTTQNLYLPDAYLAYFPIGRAGIMLLFIFTIQTLLNRLPFYIPVITGLVLFVASQLLLISAPPEKLTHLLFYVIFEAFAFALVVPQKDSLMIQFVEAKERARIMSVMFVTIIGLSTPFGWIAGELSSHNRRLPFVLNTLLYILCAVLILLIRKQQKSLKQAQDSHAF